MTPPTRTAAPAEPATTAPTRRVLTALALAMVALDLFALAASALGGDGGDGVVLARLALVLTRSLRAALALAAIAWAVSARSRLALAGAALVLLAFESGFAPRTLGVDGSQDVVADLRLVVGVVGLAVVGAAVASGRARALLIGLLLAASAGRLARDLDAAALVTPFGDVPAPPAPSTLESTPS